MLTGLIAYVGQVAKIEQADTSARLSITCPPITAEIKIGDSVSVNGVCLTVTDFDKSSFAVDVMGQTLNLSSIGKLLVADSVNLELATKSQDRLGGHIAYLQVRSSGELPPTNLGDRSSLGDLQVQHSYRNDPREHAYCAP